MFEDTALVEFKLLISVIISLTIIKLSVYFMESIPFVMN